MSSSKFAGNTRGLYTLRNAEAAVSMIWTCQGESISVYTQDNMYIYTENSVLLYHIQEHG